MNDIVTAVFLCIVILIAFFFALYFYDLIKLRRLKKSYNPENDKSKIGEQRRKEGKGIGTRELISKGSDSTGTDSLLQTTEVSFNGKTSPSPRKTSPSNRGFFKALRRK